jgi:hypothetical protein
MIKQAKKMRFVLREVKMKGIRNVVEGAKKKRERNK